MYNISSHFRIVVAFVMREIATRYGKNPGGYIWALIEPVAFIAIMSQIMGVFGKVPPVGESFALFYSTGYLGYNFFKAMEGYLSSAISSNRNLLAYPVVAPVDAVVARFILQGATSVVVTGVIIGAELLTGRYEVRLNWAPILEAIGLAWIFAFGIASLNIVLFDSYPLYQKVYSIVTRPLLLLSGVLFLPNSMPEPMKGYILSNPIAHIIILFRRGFYGQGGADGLNLQFLIITSTATLFMGLGFFTFWRGARSRRI
ncbi:ABC transporter permease [Rhizobium sp. XQZ8]|uniref:ABC transporter permease n=1 Tax=Rhizobium populisoli TaxID=2859785 RepID=UPI001CA549CC|nr:ABC transporter permease [Rhizobium populisoli]MBW6420184.1 ABC transporter permease [Rhizobium populisoli]